MLCKKCTETAIFDTPSLCKLHFSMYIEGKVFDTIKRFKLISPKEKIVVAPVVRIVLPYYIFFQRDLTLVALL